MMSEAESKPKTFSKAEVEAGLQLTNSEFFMQTVALLAYTDMKDLNYAKTLVTTPDGGTYLVSILHIDGPVLDLKKLAELAEAPENKNG